MGHSWIIDVLADLRNFAQKNDLALLADKLDQTATVASAEIAAMSEGKHDTPRNEVNECRSVFRGARATGRA